MDQMQKKLVMDSFRSMKKFLFKLARGKSGKKALDNLHFELECNAIGLPADIAEKILSFTEHILDPMIYEHDIVFEDCESLIQVIDGEKQVPDSEVPKFLFYYHMTILETNDVLNDFGQTELRPYLIAE